MANINNNPNIFLPQPISAQCSTPITPKNIKNITICLLEAATGTVR